MREYAGYVVMAVGAAFDLFGCVGLVRLPDVYNRLQAATKCVTLGTLLVLLGGALVAGRGDLAAKAALCGAFVLLTSPTAAHALARGAYASGAALCEQTVVDRYGEALGDPRGEGGAGR